MTEQGMSRREKRDKFLRELGSIVLGVLIALGLGAVASEIGWRIEARQAREALGDELGEIVGQAHERESADKCLERKLDQVAAIVDGAEASMRLPAVGEIGDPLHRTWSTGVWESTLSADIGSHMDRNTLDNLSGVYQFVANINIYTRDEVQAWTELHAIVGPGRAIGTDEIRSLRSAISRARMANRQMQVGAIRVYQIVKAFDLPVSAETVAEYSVLSRERYCAPIAAPAGEHYGAAPYNGIGARVRADPITRDSDSGN